MEQYIAYGYLISAVLFMIGLKRLSSPATARVGNWISMAAMAIAIAATALNADLDFKWIIIGGIAGAIIGAVASRIVAMTAMPEMIAIFNGCGGAASALVATAEFVKLNPQAFDGFNLGTILLSVIIGAFTVTGSILAFIKLQELITGAPIVYKGQQFVNAILALVMVAAAVGLFYRPEHYTYFYIMLGLAAALGILLVLPIGGADMPVVISLLNSYSGVAVSMTGFVLNNNALIIVGSMVGAAGLILTKIMCDAMNRSIGNVIFGAFGAVSAVAADAGDGPKGSVKVYTVDDLVIVLQNADSVIFVPGYGMAAGQAQHVVRELGDMLEADGVDVKYAIHPVAGRMPGHMNVLLAEADVSYDKLYAMEDINDDFKNTDVVIVVGANDVVNPGAKTNPASPIYGMPVLNVEEARTVVVLKRSLGVGFAGIDNELFFYENTMMVLGNAKQSLQGVIEHLND